MSKLVVLALVAWTIAGCGSATRTVTVETRTVVHTTPAPAPKTSGTTASSPAAATTPAKPIRCFTSGMTMMTQWSDGHVSVGCSAPLRTCASFGGQRVDGLDGDPDYVCLIGAVDGRCPRGEQAVNVYGEFDWADDQVLRCS